MIGLKGLFMQEKFNVGLGPQAMLDIEGIWL